MDNPARPATQLFPFHFSLYPFNFKLLQPLQPFNLFYPMEPDDSERRSRDIRPQPTWRHPATPCKAARISNIFPIIFTPRTVVDYTPSHLTKKGNPQ